MEESNYGVSVNPNLRLQVGSTMITHAWKGEVATKIPNKACLLRLPHDLFVGDRPVDPDRPHTRQPILAMQKVLRGWTTKQAGIRMVAPPFPLARYPIS